MPPITASIVSTVGTTAMKLAERSVLEKRSGGVSPTLYFAIIVAALFFPTVSVWYFINTDYYYTWKDERAQKAAIKKANKAAAKLVKKANKAAAKLAKKESKEEAKEAKKSGYVSQATLDAGFFGVNSPRSHSVDLDTMHDLIFPQRAVIQAPGYKMCHNGGSCSW